MNEKKTGLYNYNKRKETFERTEGTISRLKKQNCPYNYFWWQICSCKRAYWYEFGKDADLRISSNWTVIWDTSNDVSGRRFEERTSISDWTSIWVYHIYHIRSILFCVYVLCSNNNSSSVHICFVVVTQLGCQCRSNATRFKQ